ncbi:MAG: hypothetical protein V1874_11135 [Spirochaetota bacterium]
MKKTLLIIVFLIITQIQDISAETVSVSGGFYAAYMPSMGGNLGSYTQETYFNSNSGIDGINRSMDGYSTSNIDRLTGVFAGFDVKAIFHDYYLIRVGANYGMSIMGGKGKTIYNDGTYHNLECEYSLKQYDFPVTVGLSIPFWKDARISLSCGTAFARATYENKFESDSTAAPFSATQSAIKGKFTGWAFPLVVIIQGDYFLKQEVALTTTIAYYKGSTKVIKDSKDNDGNIDFASIDFTGYRFNLGVSYYFYSK